MKCPPVGFVRNILVAVPSGTSVGYLDVAEHGMIMIPTPSAVVHTPSRPKLPFSIDAIVHGHHRGIAASPPPSPLSPRDSPGPKSPGGDYKPRLRIPEPIHPLVGAALGPCRRQGWPGA